MSVSEKTNNAIPIANNRRVAEGSLKPAAAARKGKKQECTVRRRLIIHYHVLKDTIPHKETTDTLLVKTTKAYT